jgi:soluble lytic murein transglycosylase-like protein
MIFLSVESKPLSFRRRVALAAVMLVAAVTIAPSEHPSEGSQEWSIRSTPKTLPHIDWTATPPAPQNRLQKQPLDMSYPEVEALLLQRMARHNQPEQIRATANQIIRLCHLLGFQPSFILAVIEHESSFKSRIVSPAGAIGLMQLLPATGRVVGSQMNIAVPHGGANLKDPVVNVTLGMHYLAQLQDDFKTPASTLAAYNLGPQRWVEFLARPGNDRPRAVAKYVSLIERTSKQMREAGRLAYLNATP